MHVGIASETFPFDPYKMLGLKRDATRTQVRRAYLIMAKRHHPDKGGDPERFNAAKRAYDILSDPARRKKFDFEPQRRPRYGR